MKVDQVRDSVNCRVDEVRYFVKIVDVVRVDQVRVDQVGCSLANMIMRLDVAGRHIPYVHVHLEHQILTSVFIFHFSCDAQSFKICKLEKLL